jgi:hypothetical protein
MALIAEKAEPLERLEHDLRLAPMPAPSLFSRVIADACTRIPALRTAGKAAELDRLVAADAWTDAAFALIALELPTWQVKRLWREESAWFCSLSQRPAWPAALDDTADAAHEELPLAVLLAFLQARRLSALAVGTRLPVPHLQQAADGTVCCDNFA